MKITDKKHLWWLSPVENIAKEQVNLLFKQAIVANYTVIIASILVCFIMAEFFPLMPLISWTIIMLTLSIIRLIITRQTDNIKLNHSVRLYFILTLLMGVLWSLLPLMCFDEGYVRYVIIIITLTVGASGIVILSSVLLLTPSYIIPPILTLAYAFYTHGTGHEQYIPFVLIFILIPLLMRTAINFNASLVYTLLMSEHLDELVSQRTMELQNSRQEAIDARNEAEKANKSKSNFLANMSHELRTPMHGILSFASMGISKFDKVSDEKKLYYFNNIKISGNRLLLLLNELLDLAKLEAHKMEINFRQGSLHTTVQSCVTEQQARLKKLSQKIIYMPDNITGKGEFDEPRIGQVITNLLSNAIKFNPEGRSIEFTINNSSIENDDDTKIPALLVSVRDHGVGIPDGENETIFDKFIQSTGSQVGISKGTGLGLAICKEIIDLHHGKIWAENHPDGGAVLSFVIPVAQPEDAKQGKEE